MALELYIEDELIDLIGDEQIATDYAIAEIGNFATRKGFRSINFDVPKTANNKRILGNSDIVNNTTVKPYRRLKARVFVNGIDQNIRFADIESVQDNFSLRLYGGNANFFEALKNITLEDVDLSQYNHFRTASEVINSRTNTSGYLYAIIDYHGDSPNASISNTSKVYNTDFALPSIFINSLLEKTAETLGYTINNNLASDTENIILPTITPIRNSDGSRYIVKAKPTSNEDYTGLDNFINFETLVIGSDYFTAPDPLLWDQTIVFQDEVRLKGELQLTLRNVTVASQTVTIEARLSRPAPTLFEDIVLDTLTVTNVNQTFVIPFDLEPTSDDGRVELEFVINSTDLVTVVANTSFYHIQEVEIITPLQIDVNNNYVTLNSLLSNTKPSDIFKNYAQMFCCIFQVNEETKTININRFDDIAQNIPLALDWSEKIDYTENEKLEFALDKYAQSNLMIYKDDDNVIKPFGTDGQINIDDTTLDAENDLIKLIYGATINVVRLIDYNLPQVGIYIQGNIKEKPLPRILFTEKVSGDIDIDSTNITTNIPLAWFILTDKSNNLGFANNLIELYYGGLQDVLTRTKIVTERIRLTPLDIQALNFLIPVYLDKHNAYFYISKISGFDYGSSESTEVELVKLR